MLLKTHFWTRHIFLSQWKDLTPSKGYLQKPSSSQNDKTVLKEKKKICVSPEAYQYKMKIKIHLCEWIIFGGRELLKIHTSWLMEPLPYPQ